MSEKPNPQLQIAVCDDEPMDRQQDFFFLTEGFVTVQQGLPELIFPEGLCQIPGGGDLVAPQGQLPIG